MEQQINYLDFEGMQVLIEQLRNACETRKFKQIIMIDNVTGYEYVVEMQDDQLISYRVRNYTGIEVTSLPYKTEYVAGEIFDPSGMVVVIIDEEGNSTEISDYTYTRYATDEIITINYIDSNGVEYVTTIEVTLTPFDPTVALMDFEYVANDDGTYTITDWKETSNGEPSTECIIPDNGLINV